MRILQVIPYFWPALSFGGPVKVTLQLSQELAKRHEVTIYTSDAWDAKRRMTKSEMLKPEKKLKVYYVKNFVNSLAFSSRLYTNFGIIPLYIRHLGDFDLVHINDVFSLPQLTIATIAKLGKRSYVVSTHGVDIAGSSRRSFIKKIAYSLLVKNVLINAKHIIATSDGEALILKKLGFTNVQVVYNGIVIRKKGASKKTKKLVKSKALTLLYIGRINKLKGLDRVVKAMRVLTFPTQLLVAGPDDGEKTNLLRIINKHKLADKVQFLGFVDEEAKEKLYGQADLFIYPSRLEGFSISILEAMDHSLPVIITKECNFPDVAKFKAGLVLSNLGIENQLSTHLKNLYHNRDKLEKMAVNAKKLINAKYSIGAMAKNVEKLYA